MRTDDEAYGAALAAGAGEVSLPDSGAETGDMQGLSGIEGACRGDRMSGVRVTSNSGIIAFC